MRPEAAEQKALFDWASYTFLKDYLFAIPNGGSRHILEARNLKLQGVKSGVPDIFLALPTKTYHGLFIELKTPKNNKPSANQEKWIRRLNQIGYKAVLAIGWIQAKEEIEKYIHDL